MRSPNDESIRAVEPSVAAMPLIMPAESAAYVATGLRHLWSFLLPPRPTNDPQRVIAVCGICGAVRSTPVPSSDKEETILDLRGQCRGGPTGPTEICANEIFG